MNTQLLEDEKLTFLSALWDGSLFVIAKMLVAVEAYLVVGVTPALYCSSFYLPFLLFSFHG